MQSDLPPEVEAATELPLPGALPALRNPVWAERFPWLVHGITTRGPDEKHPFDLRTSGVAGVEGVLDRWFRLKELTGAGLVVHSRQPHEARLRVHQAGNEGVHIAPPCDGHITRAPGVLLTVSVADCVPVFLLAPADPPTVGLLHAGWRGIAAGILEEALATLERRLGIEPERLELYLGPAISGANYEVSADVHRALGQSDPGRPTPIDLRRVLAERAVAAGVLPSRIQVSTHCTRDHPDLFSHRGGDRERQVAFLGLRDSSGGEVVDAR